MEQFGGDIFEKLVFHLDGGDIKNLSLICSIDCLLQRLDKIGGTFFNARPDVMFLRCCTHII